MGVKCPKCGSKSVDVHPIDLTPYHWYLCLECSYVWDDPGYDELLKARGKIEDLISRAAALDLLVRSGNKAKGGQ